MKFTRHLAGYLPVNLATALASFGGVYAFSRLLGADEYGRYALMFSVMALIHTASLAAAESAAYRFTASARAKGDLADHFATIRGLLLRSLGVAALMMLVVAILLRDMPDYLAIVPWIAVLLPLGTAIQTALEAHRASHQVRRYAIIATSKLLGGFVVGVLVAWKTDAGAAAPFIGLAAASGVLFLSEASWLWGQGKGGESDAARRKTYLGYGLPIAAALCLDLLLSAADRILIAIFMGEASVGEYAAGYGVADKTVLLICAWAAMAGSPLVMSAYEDAGPDAAAREAGGLIRIILLVGLPAATGLALVAAPLAEAMIGEELRAGAIRIIPWIAFSGLLNGLLIHYYSEAFQLARKTGERALLMSVPVIVNILANLILIPLFGLLGAVGATIGSYLVGITLLSSFGRKYIALPFPLFDFAKIGLACLAMWPAVQLVPDLGSWAELFAKAIVGGVTYAVVAFVIDAGGARTFVQDSRAASRQPEIS
ncbi:lipopolysaccharide biosynthesis protein [Henriciella pelagia]|uniref:Polysaccharide biosynthesis protein n=1 Tax=Henriciella pelagia TaxID=1977912 RepID=A0ABQ1JI56_9PROT|nr:lipopolysaccharide biosynthesis protein [Henriciella pelagia]GGB69572.1 polysaccharide biosynthesis protein [Henriciella pelagia]